MDKYVIDLKDHEGNKYDFRIWQVFSVYNNHKVLLGEFFEHSDALLFKNARIKNDEEFSKIMEECNDKYKETFKKLADS